MAESTKTRSSVLLIGRDCDLNFLIELSLLTATIKIDRTIPFDFEEKLGWIKKEIIYKDGKPERYYIEKNLK